MASQKLPLSTVTLVSGTNMNFWGHWHSNHKDADTELGSQQPHWFLRFPPLPLWRESLKFSQYFLTGLAPCMPVLSPASRRAEKEVSKFTVQHFHLSRKRQDSKKVHDWTASPREQADSKQVAPSRSWLEKRNQKWEVMGWLEGMLLGETQAPDLEVCFLEGFSALILSVGTFNSHRKKSYLPK